MPHHMKELQHSVEEILQGFDIWIFSNIYRLNVQHNITTELVKEMK